MNATVVKKSMHGMETLFRQLRNMTLKKPSTGKRKKSPRSFIDEPEEKRVNRKKNHPWEDANPEVVKTFILRLNQQEKEKIRFIVDNTLGFGQCTSSATRR